MLRVCLQLFIWTGEGQGFQNSLRLQPFQICCIKSLLSEFCEGQQIITLESIVLIILDLEISLLMFLFTPLIFLSGFDKIADNSVCDQMARKEQKTASIGFK